MFYIPVLLSPGISPGPLTPGLIKIQPPRVSPMADGCPLPSAAGSQDEEVTLYTPPCSWDSDTKITKIKSNISFLPYIDVH